MHLKTVCNDWKWCQTFETSNFQGLNFQGVKLHTFKPSNFQGLKLQTFKHSDFQTSDFKLLMKLTSGFIKSYNIIYYVWHVNILCYIVRAAVASRVPPRRVPPVAARGREAQAPAGGNTGSEPPAPLSGPGPCLFCGKAGCVETRGLLQLLWFHVCFHGHYVFIVICCGFAWVVNGFTWFLSTLYHLWTIYDHTKCI